LDKEVNEDGDNEDGMDDDDDNDKAGKLTCRILSSTKRTSFKRCLLHGLRVYNGFFLSEKD
jgi:hypothetical protein